MYTVKIPVLELKKIESIAKLLKSEYIYITELGQVFGCSNFNTVFYEINQELIVTAKDTRKNKQEDILTDINVIFNVLELKEYLKTALIGDDVDILVRTGDFVTYNGLESRMYMQNMFTRAINMLGYDSLTPGTVIDLTNHEAFNEAINLPASKGNSLVVFDKDHQITIHKGMLPINKGDKTSLTLHDVRSDRFLAVFTITKKHNIMIRVYMYCLFLR